jgi:hypothetical protein
MTKGFMYLVAVIDWHSRYVFYNPNFDATVLGYKTQNNALTQIVIQALSDTHSYVR